ncbi:hypothetical protein [Latilactobacillus curvatus]|uniref:hypothetical protein n=1 Tax=Latilactobacillus curvatus TaxID=28038 RepID=UPI00241178AC|nr:hypothetical protein [Latilactobacillus curvatus]MDG2984321.1 hypothetical protein [Latilactobacillus curvatus]
MSLYLRPTEPISEKSMHQFITEVRSKLKSNLAEIDIPESHFDIFSWYKRGITFLFIISGPSNTFSDDPELLIIPYLNNDNSDKFEYIDLKDFSSNMKFRLMDEYGQRDSFLLDHIIKVNQILADNIIYDYVFIRTGNSDAFANSWFAFEYKKGTTELQSKPILNSLPDFNSDIFHQTIYRFDDVITGLNDSQFNIELDEVLFSYNHAKWFVAASGCGGLLEHMYALVVENYSNINSLVAKHNTSNPDSKISKVQKLPGSATAQDYITTMNLIYNTLTDLSINDNEILKFDTRQKTRAQTTFQIRNSVSHYNSGLTCKEDVERMLLELKDTYDTFYLPSKLFKDNH